MKADFLIISVTLPFFLSCQESNENEANQMNPFLRPYNTPFAVPEFNKISIEDYLPAIEKGIIEQQVEIGDIIDQQEEPTFSNTVEALDYSGELLDRVTSVFYNLLSANTSKELQELARTISPMLSKQQDEILMNGELFRRVKFVYEHKDNLNLNTENEKLLEKHYLRFVRNGALLEDNNKEELKKINEKLSLLGLKFNDNLLAEDNNWKLVIDGEEDLDGLPDILRSSAAAAAKEAGLDNKWVITLHKPSWIPFLQYSSKRELREKVYKAWMNRGSNGNEYDNTEIIREMIALRDRKARLLGYDNWASYVLEDNMAKTPEAVYELLNSLWIKALPVAEKEAASLQKMIDREGTDFELAPWDWWYYAEKVRKEKYDLDDELLRPYFELNNVQKGLFYVINKLYGIGFREMKELPTPHPDARAYEVLEEDGTHIGILYMDFYPRASKSGGAWMNEYRKQYVRNGKNITPVITTVFNFTKPSGEQPALLTFDEVTTMFHEIGHALHGLLSECTYYSLSCTAVPRDFVELPSQIMENWAGEPEVLKIYARHYRTGEIIPDDLIAKMKKSSKFNQGFATVEYLAASLLDMAYHTTDNTNNIDPDTFEKQEMDKIGLIPEIIPRYKSTYFAHIFTGDGYSAGYYSYKWAEVLDADAFEAFKETGDIFNPEVARSFRDYVLSRGGTDEAMNLYVKFRGKKPGIEPLLKRSGLL